jgi:hypothetical protein
LEELDQALPAYLVANRLEVRKERPRIGKNEAILVRRLRIFVELVNGGVGRSG